MAMPGTARPYIDAGLREHNGGNLAAAVAAYQHALALSPDDPVAHNLLGTALVQMGQTDAGLPHLERAVRRQRDNADLLGNLAQAYFALGRYDDAREAFRKASRLDPRSAQFQLGIANSCAMQGKLAEAEALLLRIVQRFPGEPLAWFNYGNVLRDSGRIGEALSKFARAVELAPDFVEARNNWAGALHNLQRFHEAEEAFRTCIEQAPDYLVARCNLASVLIDVGRFGEAESICRDVIRDAPDLAIARTYLGAALGHQGRLVEALVCHRAAAEFSADDIRAVETYAGALTDIGHYGEGMRRFRRALTLDPESLPSHQMLGTALLARGNFAEGWAEYAYRPARLRFAEKYRDVSLAVELPANLDGQHVCLLREQGLGDEVFFLRWVHQLKERRAHISYRASDKIRSLVERVDALDEVLEDSMSLPAADHYMMIGDVPHALSMLPTSAIPRLPPERYTGCIADFSERMALFWPPVPAPLQLTPLEDRLAAARERLARAGPPPYLGLTWRGGTLPEEQHGASWVLYKEIAVERLAAAVAAFPGTALALQRKPAPGEIEAFSTALGRPLHDLTAFNEDLEGMLALLALIDEYVGVSNTNMHLRAGVGRGARVLVPCPAEWRWMHAGSQSPWFPDFSVYRQSAQGDWRVALATLGNDLRAAYGVASR